jgi:hypothetical protein
MLNENMLPKLEMWAGNDHDLFAIAGIETGFCHRHLDHD